MKFQPGAILYPVKVNQITRDSRSLWQQITSLILLKPTLSKLLFIFEKKILLSFSIIKTPLWTTFRTRQPWSRFSRPMGDRKSACTGDNLKRSEWAMGISPQRFQFQGLAGGNVKNEGCLSDLICSEEKKIHWEFNLIPSACCDIRKSLDHRSRDVS